MTQEEHEKERRAFWDRAVTEFVTCEGWDYRSAPLDADRLLTERDKRFPAPAPATAPPAEVEAPKKVGCRSVSYANGSARFCNIERDHSYILTAAELYALAREAEKSAQKKRVKYQVLWLDTIVCDFKTIEQAQQRIKRGEANGCNRKDYSIREVPA